MDEKIFNAAKNGALILSVNNRLSRYLHQEYDNVQQRLGAEAWNRPEILSYPAWLARCQKQYFGHVNFLNNAQLQYVWETIVKEDMRCSGAELLNVPQAARRARQAHHLLIDHNADFNHEESAIDHQAFLRWRMKWQEVSKTRGWHDPVSTPQMLSSFFTENVAKVPRQIVFAGFDDLTPNLQCLIETLEKSGCTVSCWQPKLFENPLQQLFMGTDAVNEVKQCARWARSILEEKPSSRIGVVVPELEVYQGIIERVFAAELEAAAVMAADEERHTFNLSLGKGLDAEGVVLSALRLLRCERLIEQRELSWLLHTPYVSGGISEASTRAKLDREILSKRLSVWRLTKLSGYLSWMEEKHSLIAPELKSLLENLVSGTASRSKQFPSGWAEHFSIFLKQLKWPGERTLSSREYQAVNSFKDVLAEFASLDGVSEKLSRSEAVQLLTRLTGSKSFQPEGKGAPVQVLGELESAGLLFDHLWVLGLHDKALPSSPAPSPFIPLPVQRRYKMKRVDAQREHLFSEQLVKRLFFAAPRVVLSWPSQKDGTSLGMSPFIPENLSVYETNEKSKSPAAIICGSQPTIETVVDHKGPPLPPRRTFSGGTGILKDQALCPFRAFAHYRLRAQQADSSDIGIDNMSRGTLAHTVLEIFWEDVRDHKSLENLPLGEFADRISKAVDAALDLFERSNRYDLPKKQREIEASRLYNLTESWLAIEKKRRPFAVQAAEKGQQISIGDLVIRTRIDRIDSLADGRCAIIDYKTGLPDPSQWLDVRITEPQLPVYCLSMQRQQVGAVMFGVVRGKEKECGFKGLARDVEGWPGMTSKSMDRLLEEHGWEDFDQVLEHWQRALNERGDSFANGDADVDPVSFEKACKYCDLKNLCRISEKDADWQEGGDG